MKLNKKQMVKANSVKKSAKAMTSQKTIVTKLVAKSSSSSHCTWG